MVLQNVLVPKRLRIHGFKITTSIDHVAENIIYIIKTYKEQCL
jgi:hypothetical protein